VSFTVTAFFDDSCGATAVTTKETYSLGGYPLPPTARAGACYQATPPASRDKRQEWARQEAGICDGGGGETTEAQCKKDNQNKIWTVNGPNCPFPVDYDEELSRGKSWTNTKACVKCTAFGCNAVSAKKTAEACVGVDEEWTPEPEFFPDATCATTMAQAETPAYWTAQSLCEKKLEEERVLIGTKNLPGSVGDKARCELTAGVATGCVYTFPGGIWSDFEHRVQPRKVCPTAGCKYDAGTETCVTEDPASAVVCTGAEVEEVHPSEVQLSFGLESSLASAAANFDMVRAGTDGCMIPDAVNYDPNAVRHSMTTGTTKHLWTKAASPTAGPCDLSECCADPLADLLQTYTPEMGYDTAAQREAARAACAAGRRASTEGGRINNAAMCIYPDNPGTLLQMSQKIDGVNSKMSTIEAKVNSMVGLMSG